MKTKKLSFKIILGFALIFLVFSVYSFPERAYAGPLDPDIWPGPGTPTSQGTPSSEPEETNNNTYSGDLMPLPDVPFDPFDILWKALNWFFNIVIILGIIFIIYAGFTYITSSGDPSKTKRALQILMYALIGIAIAILAKALINFVSDWLGAGEILQ